MVTHHPNFVKFTALRAGKSQSPRYQAQVILDDILFSLEWAASALKSGVTKVLFL
jgi:hypothetical protein